MKSKTGKPFWLRDNQYLVGVILALVLFLPLSASAQVRVAAYSFSHGAGFTSGESVRIGVSLGQAAAGLSSSAESASGAGFWYATRDRLVIVASESDPPPDGVPTDFELRANYPNPFNPSTRIRYGVPKKVFVRIGVYNVLGQLVSSLVAKEQPAGYYDVDWNGRDAHGASAPSGVYFYRIETDDFASTRSMVLQK